MQSVYPDAKIDSRTAECKWTGERMDYSTATESRQWHESRYEAERAANRFVKAGRFREPRQLPHFLVERTSSTLLPPRIWGWTYMVFAPAQVDDATQRCRIGRYTAPTLMKPITAEEARSYLERWSLAAAAERRELLASSLDVKARQLAALMASAHLFPDPERAASEEQVHARWTKIRQAYGFQ